MMRKLVRIWKYSLGSFSDDKTRPYDNYVVCIRSVIFLSYLVTNCFIIGGVIRHWNNKGDAGATIYICADKPNNGYWCTKQ